MGLLQRLGLDPARRLEQLSAVTQLGIRSPMAEGSLAAVILSDLIAPDSEWVHLTREEALSIPAVSKVRNLLVSTVAGWPLKSFRAAVPADGATDATPEADTTRDHPWLYRTDDPNQSPYDRMAWTVDDVLFYGCSLWLTERGSADGSGRRPILRAWQIHQSEWEITDGNILVNEHEVDEDEILLFNPPFAGLLNVANRTLRGARDTEKAWVGRMRNPIPLVELRITDDTNLSQDEAREYVKAWSTARRAVDGGVEITPPGMELVPHGEVDAALYIEGRNAIRTDVGSFTNVRASMLDGTIGIDSLTYSTKEGDRNLFYEFDIPFWSDPIEETLSGDKCVPRGQRVRFDKYEAYNAPVPTGLPVED